MPRRWKPWRYNSIEEWYEAIYLLSRHRAHAARAVKNLGFDPDGLSIDLAKIYIDWEDVEQISRPFFVSVEPMRAALRAKAEALAAVARERLRQHGPDGSVNEEVNQRAATIDELQRLPLGPFSSRPDRMSEHALALYEFLAAKCFADRKREGRRYPRHPQRYNSEAMGIVRKILARYYDTPSGNIKARLQAARRTLQHRQVTDSKQG
jgi:hypothetical protein